MVISVDGAESWAGSAPTFRTADSQHSDVDSSRRPLVKRKNVHTRFMERTRSPIATPRRSVTSSVDCCHRLAMINEVPHQSRGSSSSTGDTVDTIVAPARKPQAVVGQPQVPASPGPSDIRQDSVSSARGSGSNRNAHFRGSQSARLPGPAIYEDPAASVIEDPKRRCFPPSSMWEASPLVHPPWSGLRANRDYPPKDKVVERQLDYQQMLDKQVDKKAQAHRRHNEDEKILDKSTGRSLATSTHEWGMEASSPSMERAVYHELLATVEYKRNKDKFRKDSEYQDYLKWRQDYEQTLVGHYHSARQQEKQEKAHLAAVWKLAAEEKRQREIQERQSDKNWEREAVSRLKEGMLPPRRMRKPPQELVCGHVAQVQLRSQMAQ